MSEAGSSSLNAFLRSWLRVMFVCSFLGFAVGSQVLAGWLWGDVGFYAWSGILATTLLAWLTKGWA